jgi:WD40 repeat protein
MVHKPCRHAHDVSCIAYSPDGRLLATAAGSRIHVWDATSGKRRFTCKGHTNEIMGVAFSPDGRRLFSMSWDQTIRIWDVRRGKEEGVIQGTGDLKAIAAGSDTFPYRVIERVDETVIEDAVTGTPVAWFPEPLAMVVTHAGGRTWAGVRRNGRHLYVLSLAGATQE